MVGDLLLLFGGGSILAVMGLALILFSHRTVRVLAELNRRQLETPEGRWSYAVFQKTPFEFVQRKTSGKATKEMLEAASADASSWPFMIWFVRFMGAFSLLIAFAFFAGGISRLV